MSKEPAPIHPSPSWGSLGILVRLRKIPLVTDTGRCGSGFGIGMIGSIAAAQAEECKAAYSWPNEFELG